MLEMFLVTKIDQTFQLHLDGKKGFLVINLAFFNATFNQSLYLNQQL